MSKERRSGYYIVDEYGRLNNIGTDLNLEKLREKLTQKTIASTIGSIRGVGASLRKKKPKFNQ